MGRLVSTLAIGGVVSSLCIAWGVSAQPLRPWLGKVPPDQAAKKNPLPATPETIAAGQVTYTNVCLPCHGPTAQGDGPAAQFIKPPPKPLIVDNKLSVADGLAFWVVTNGVDGTGMASMAEAMPEIERWQVIAYLNSLAAARAAAAGAPAAATAPAKPVTPAPPPPPKSTAPAGGGGKPTAPSGGTGAKGSAPTKP